VAFGLMWVRLGRSDALLMVTALLSLAIPLAALLMRGLDTAADA
jgi:hypothetical protein